MLNRKTVLFSAALIVLALAVTACNKSGSSPTATAKAFYEATKTKDVDGMKKALSKKSLEMMEAFAKMGNKSLDESLKESNPTKQPPSFEAQNEKINGDTATLDVKDENGKWQSVPFVKEDGQWKIALDQLLEKAFSQMGSEKGGLDSGTPKSGTEGAQPKTGTDAEPSKTGNENQQSTTDK
jgi:hypothetical protein